MFSNLVLLIFHFTVYHSVSTYLMWYCVFFTNIYYSVQLFLVLYWCSFSLFQSRLFITLFCQLFWTWCNCRALPPSPAVTDSWFTHLHVCLFPSSIIWYRPKSGDGCVTGAIQIYMLKSFGRNVCTPPTFHWLWHRLLLPLDITYCRPGYSWDETLRLRSTGCDTVCFYL